MKQRATPCIVSHGGAGNSPQVVDGCERASRAGLAALTAGARAIDAAVAAVVLLEDDPRMNAGTGSVLRLDGRLQMDASVMDTAGFGAVAVVEDVKNPVKLARSVYDSPHMLVAGAGADALAMRLGLERAAPATTAQRERHAERMRGLDSDATFLSMYRDVPAAFVERATATGASDTVGAVVHDGVGGFAAAGSTGGIWCAVRGRVGDVPIPGAGLWVGEAGAVAATGIGEVIWREMLARRVHDAMADGASAQAAVDQALALMAYRHPGADVGLIAVDRFGSGGGSTAQMPWRAVTGAL